jgi:hypothetical protein
MGPNLRDRSTHQAIPDHIQNPPEGEFFSDEAYPNFQEDFSLLFPWRIGYETRLVAEKTAK